MSLTVKHSEHRFSKVMVSSRTKLAGRVRAGEIMQMLYNAAHKVARKHAGADVTAVRVEEMRFLQPLHYGSIVAGHAFLTFVGNTSMEVKVDLYLDDIVSSPLLTSYFVMVALDEQQQPKKVPELALATAQEKELFAAGKERYLQRKRGDATPR